MVNLRMIRKVVGIPQLVVGVLCFTAVSFLITYGMYPQEASVLYFQMACVAAGFLSLLLGLESVAFPSQDKRGDRNSLIFDIALGACLALALIVTGLQFAAVYLGESAMDAEPELWDNTTLTLYTLSYALATVSAILLIITLAPLGFLLYKNYRS